MLLVHKALFKSVGDPSAWDRDIRPSPEPARDRSAGQGLLLGSLLHLTGLSIFNHKIDDTLSYLTTGCKKTRMALEKQVTWKSMKKKVMCFQNNHTSNSISITSHFTRLSQRHSRKHMRKTKLKRGTTLTISKSKNQFNLPKQCKSYIYSKIQSIYTHTCLLH